MDIDNTSNTGKNIPENRDSMGVLSLLKDGVSLNTSEILGACSNLFHYGMFLQSKSGIDFYKVIVNNDTYTSKKLKTFLNQVNRAVTNIKEGNKFDSSELSMDLVDIKYIENPGLLRQQILIENILIENNISFNAETDFDKEFFNIVNKKLLTKGLIAEPINKWIGLSKVTFGNNSKEMISFFIDEIGFIPEQLFTVVSFNQNSFKSMSDSLSVIRKKETETTGTERNYHIKYIRRQLLKYSFLDKKGKKGKINGICARNKTENRNQVTLDSNGVLIKIFDNPDKIVSHIPYQFCEDILTKYWLENNWIEEAEYQEIIFQKLKYNDHQNRGELFSNKQVNYFLDSLNIGSENNYSDFLDMLLDDMERLIEVILGKNLIIPDILLEKILEEKDTQVYFKLFQLAELITIKLSKQVLLDEGDMFKNYELAYRTRNAYQTRMKYLKNNTNYYNVYKIFSILVNKGLFKQEDLYSFAGEYSSKRGKQKIIEVCYKNDTSRILLSDEKHIDKNIKVELETLPLLQKNDFENLELLLRSGKIALEALENISVSINQNQTNKEVFIKNTTIVTYFIQNYYPELYGRFEKIHFGTHSDISVDEEYGKLDIKFCIESIKAFLGRYLTNPEKNGFTGDGEIKNHTRSIDYDGKYLSALRTSEVADYAYDEGLFGDGISSKVYDVGKTDSGYMSYLQELESTQSLGLSSNKPLLIVSGGCKNMDIGGVSLIDNLSNSIIRSGIKLGANISIPCTQSGIGVSMSKAYIKYQDITMGLPNTQNSKVFAIAPSEIMADLGGDDGEFSKGKYAASTVDQIYIGCGADWGLTGKDVINADYFKFVNYADQIYSRLSSVKGGSHIIMNGGLFTIAEALPSLLNNRKIFLVKETGRLSDALISIYESIEDFKGLGQAPIKKEGSFSEYIQFFDNIKHIIAKNMPHSDFEEWLSKDWGRGDLDITNNDIVIENLDDFFDKYSDLLIENNSNLLAKNILYRINFYKFIMTSINVGNIPTVVNKDDLEESLN